MFGGSGLDVVGCVVIVGLGGGSYRSSVVWRERFLGWDCGIVTIDGWCSVG